MSINKKRLYINFDTGNLIDDEGAILMGRPSISFGAAPQWELHFCRVMDDGSLSGADLSEAVSWTAAVDTDFLSSTMPMIRTLPSGIISTQAASGILTVNLDANTTTFFEKVDGRNSVNAYFEVRGKDSEDKVLYDYRTSIYALGSVDPQGGEPIPPAEGGATIGDVYALLRAPVQYQFSDDGVEWHDTQQEGDIYYQSRYPDGAWSEAITLVKGTDGADGYNVKFEYSEDGISNWHTPATSADFYMRTSSDNGEHWTVGLLFKGTNGNGYRLVGEYNEETTYNPVSVNDAYEVVTYEGSSYAYIADTASSGHTPPTATLIDNYWMTLAKKGDTGSVDNVTTEDITDLDSYMDNRLSGYVEDGMIYTREQVDSLLLDKANTDDVYTTDAADATFASFDYLNQQLGNYVRLSQWSNQNTIVSGQINYLSAAIDNIPSGGGDLSAYTPLSTTQSVSAYLQNEIENIPAGEGTLTGVYLNNEPCFEVSDRAYVLALPIATVMPSADLSRQSFMMYLGTTDTTGTASAPDDRHIKGHIYERVLDPSMPPPTITMYLNIPAYGVTAATLTENNSMWATSSSAEVYIEIVKGSDGRCVDNCWKIYVGGQQQGIIPIVSDAVSSGEDPWEAVGWKNDSTREAVEVNMVEIVTPGGGDGHVYHWEDISPWANNN